MPGPEMLYNVWLLMEYFHPVAVTVLPLPHTAQSAMEPLTSRNGEGEAPCWKRHEIQDYSIKKTMGWSLFPAEAEETFCLTTGTLLCSKSDIVAKPPTSN